VWKEEFVSLIGQTLGQYRIVEFIGAGGMASVYKAYQSSLDRHVAIKVLPAQHALTPGYKDRFIQEARAVAQLSHPNILPIYDFGLEGDLSYFVMKYVPDHTLADLMGQPLDLIRVSHIVGQLAGALDHAHTKGIVHRDVKPSNMLLEGDWLLLTDFGLAKITEASTVITSTGHIFGTPAYVSPEQAEGLPLDHRTDIYSLGIVMYEMVVGRVPFEGSTAMRIINKHIHELPPPPSTLRPDLPAVVEQVMLRALAKQPEDRYSRALDLATALREAVESASQTKHRIDKPAMPALRPEEIPAQPPVARAVSSLEAKAVAAASPPKQGRPFSYFGLSLLVVILLLSLIGGALFFFTPGEGADESALAAATSGSLTPAAVSPTSTPTRLATVTPVPPTASPTPTATLPAAPAPTTATLPAAAPTSLPTPSISGTLAIPVKVGPEFKVFLTGFDGAGINGPAPVSLGNARQPTFRRDGQAIAVNGAETGALRGIFVTDSRGGGPQPLNDRGEAFWPVWSPDGTELMFVDLDKGRTVFRQNSQLAKSEADYTQVQINNVNLTANNLVWSDDNRLIFQGCADWLGQSGECGIWAADAATLEPVRLTSNGGLPTDAKNGLLTYMLAEDGDWEIYLLSLSGGEPVKLTDNTSQDGLAAIAPDGQSLAYVSDESGNWAVWTVTLSDRQKQKWFDLDPQRGTIDVNSWSEERMSWTQ
jgi:serine/threonine protein kinase